MKKILSFIAIMLAALTGFSQAPGFLNYQGVARNSVGNVLVNKAITLRLTIRDGSAAGPVVYQENRGVTTNPFGLFNVQVGSPGAGSVTGTITGVNWAVGAKFIQVEIDPNGGTTFINIGTAQLASVPYSLFAALSGDLVLPFNKTQADAGTLFRITNSNTTSAGATALEGLTNSTAGNANAIIGTVTSTGPGGFSAGVRGINNGTGGLGIGVYGSQAGSGWGVYGTTPSGVGVHGQTSTGNGVQGTSAGAGVGVYGISSTGNAGRFQNTNAANPVSTVEITTNSTNAPALSLSGPGIWGSAMGITNTTSGMEWRTSVNNTTYTVTKIPGSTFSPLQLFSTGGMDFSASTGTSIMRLLDNGNVGIGTTGPFSRLTVVQNNSGVNLGGGINTGSEIKFLGFGTSHISIYNRGNNALTFANTSALAQTDVLGTPLMTLTTAGRLGIGTTTPASNLHVVGNVNITDGTQALNRVLTSDAVGNASWQTLGAGVGIGGSGTLNFIPKWTPNGTNLGNSNIFVDPTNFSTQINSTTMSVSNALNVSGGWMQMDQGVSSNFPFLHLNGIGSGANAGIIFGASSGGTDNGRFLYRTSGDYLSISHRNGGASTNGLADFVVKNGNVGVATITPTARLQVLQTGTTPAGSFTINNAANTTSGIAGINTANNVGSWGINAISETGTGFPGEATHAALVAAANTGVGIVTSSPSSYGLHAGSAGNHAIFAQQYGPTNAAVFGQGLAPNSFGVAGNAAPGTGAGGYFTGGTTALRTLGGVQLTGINEGVNRILTTTSGTGQATWEDAATAGIVSGSGTLNFLPKWTPSGTALGNSMFFDDASTANLGGGAVGNRPSSLTIWQTPGTTDASLAFRTASGEFGGMFTGADGKLHLTTNSASPSLATIGLTIDDNGVQGVGIGTTNPLAKLQIISSSVVSTPGVHINNNRLIPTPASFMQVGLDVIDSSSGGGIENSAIRGFYVGDGVGGFINVGVRGVARQNHNPSITNSATKVGTGFDFYGVHGTGQVGVMGVTTSGGAGYGIYSRGRAGVDGNLEVDGSVRITDGTEGNGYVLTSDASGNANWQGPVSISVRNLSPSPIIPDNTLTPITQWQNILNEDGGANYNPITGEYTIAVTGNYQINASIYWSGFVAGSRTRLNVLINGLFDYNTHAISSLGEFSNDLSYSRRLVAGDKVSFAVSQFSGVAQSLTGIVNTNSFSINLIHR